MNNYFATSFEEFIYVRTYSRWIDELGRREQWPETVKRYGDFMLERIPKEYHKDFKEAVKGILNKEEMPSMRVLWTAGKALERENICGYNCSATLIDDPAAFSEILYILMCGTGAGFSVERQFINKMPDIPSKFKEIDFTIVFADSKLGWAEGYARYIRELYKGNICKYDISKIRAKGERLKTFGGRASGPEPLIKLLEITKNMFINAKGRKLNSIECHDLVCHIASIVIVGGVRRCLPLTSKIQTDKGIIPLSDVNIGDYVITGGKKYKILDKENTGEKQTIKIKHKYGDFVCSLDHRIAVFKDDDYSNYIFKHAKDLKVNDCIVWDSKGFDGKNTVLPLIQQNNHFNNNKIINPTLDTDIAWLIGIIHGDGYIGKKSIEITTHTKEMNILIKANDIFKKFGLKGSIQKSHGNCYRLRVNSKTLADWFKNYIKQPKQPIKIPDFIFNGKRNIRYAYLAGVFDSDGRTRKDGIIDQVTTIYNSFFNDIKQILYGIGIGISTYIKKADPENNKQKAYTIGIRGITNKQSWLNYISDFCISGKEKQIKINKNSTKDFKYKASMFGYPRGWRKNSYITVSTAKQKNFIDDIIYYPSVITEICDGIKTETADIEIDNIKQFTTNGIVVHNSATISLSNLSDQRMANAKQGSFYITQPQRQLANNSTVYTEKPDCMQFMKEWINLIKSQTGERGIFNRQGIIKHLKKHVKRRNPNFDFISNPCVPYNTLILTEEGYKKIGDMVDKKIKIWNGKEFSEVTPFYTGNKELYEVKLSDGSILECSSNHKWVLWDGNSKNGKEYRKETIDLIIGEKLAKFNMPVINNGKNYDIDAYSQGFYTGDGTKNNTRSWIYVPKYCCESRLIGEIKQDGNGTRRRHTWIHGKMMDKSFTPINGTKQYCLDWFAGYIDADGHTQKYNNSYGLQITSIKRQQLLDIKLMLTRLGCNPKVNKCSDKKYKTWPDGNTYLSKDVYRLCLNAQDLYILYTIGLKTNRLQLNIKKPQRDARRFITIKSIKKLDKYEDVYCFNEPLNHTGTFNGIVTGQCGEVVLRSKGFCNLSEVIVRPDDTLDTLLKKVKFATIIGCVQSTLTKFKFLRKQWTDNAEEERLLGVSLTGLRDHPKLNHVHNEAKFWLEELKKTAIETSKIWAFRLGINEPTAVTCVKPSGTVSLLNNTASGLHTRFSKYYIRRVRVSKADPLCQMMIEQDIPWKPENGENIFNFQTAVFEFPIKSPDNAVCNNNIDAIEMLEYWKMLKVHWCEHNPSCFSGDTKFITDKGLKKFTDFSDNDNVNILNKDGKFVNAKIKKFGKQKIYEINLQSGQKYKTINTTKEHLWPITDTQQRYKKLPYKNIQTCDLPISKQFESVYPKLIDGFDNNGILHGIVYGDGTIYNKQRKNQYTRVDLFHHKKELSSFFENNCSKITEYDDKTVCYGLPLNFKQLPDEKIVTKQYLKSFIMGWFAADGFINEKSTVIAISNINKSVIEWLQNVAPIIGLSMSTSIKKTQIKHYKGKNNFCYTINFLKESLTKDFFINKKHIERFKISNQSSKRWKIKSIIETDRYEDVWCVEEPKNKMFVLDGNILTHNCTIFVKNDEWIRVGNWVYENWNKIGGLSFLPADQSVYEQAPYEEITAEKYNELIKTIPKINFDKLSEYELKDTTQGATELACTGNSCEIV